MRWRCVVVRLVVVVVVGGVVHGLCEELMKVRFTNPGGAVQRRDERFARAGILHVVAYRVREEIRRRVWAVKVAREMRAKAVTRVHVAVGAVGAARHPGLRDENPPHRRERRRSRAPHRVSRSRFLTTNRTPEPMFRACDFTRLPPPQHVSSIAPFPSCARSLL